MNNELGLESLASICLNIYKYDLKFVAPAMLTGETPSTNSKVMIPRKFLLKRNFGSFFIGRSDNRNY